MWFRRAGFATPETDLQEKEDNTSESNLVSALPEALQFEVAFEDDILEDEANIPVHENIASTAEDILEDIMTGRVQRASLDDEQEVEEEEVDQQPLQTDILGQNVGQIIESKPDQRWVRICTYKALDF